MTEAKLQILDEVNCKFIGLDAIHRRVLHAKSKVFNPANRYIPSVRLGRWDGKEIYFQIGGGTYINLLPEQIDYLAEQNIDIEIEDLRTYNRDFEFSPIDDNYFSNKVWPDNHQMAGQPVKLRELQVIAANHFLSDQQCIAQLPTSSGKSLLCAVLAHKVEKYGRSIVIVPNKDLISQTEQYYRDLGLDVGVYYGERKEFFKTHTICSWQSLAKLSENAIDIGLPEPVTFEKFIQGVVAVIVDEVHTAKAQLLKDLLTGPLAKVPIRWGITGTIPKEPFEIINLTITLGNVTHSVATSDLQEQGILSNCDVNILQLIDLKEFSDYATEHDFLVTDKRRLDYISKIIISASASGNVLVLVSRKETGKELEKLIPDSMFLSGATKSTTRREHYDEVATTNSKILIATSGIAAVGIDVPNINHLIMLETGKSFIRTIQSIGRALRTTKDKNHATIWDICSTCRFSKKHLTARKKYYKEQGFPSTVEKVNWLA